MLDELTLLWILSYAAAVAAREPDPRELADTAVQEFKVFHGSLNDGD